MGDYRPIGDYALIGDCHSIALEGEGRATRREYLDGTLVLATKFESDSGEARVLDCFTMRRGGAQDPHRQLVRVIEGVSGHIELRLTIAPRFDYGEVPPWLRRAG